MTPTAEGLFAHWSTGKNRPFLSWLPWDCLRSPDSNFDLPEPPSLQELRSRLLVAFVAVFLSWFCACFWAFI